MKRKSGLQIGILRISPLRVTTDSDRTGFYIMRAGNGALLVIVSNFEPGRRTAHVALDYAALALPEGLRAYMLIFLNDLEPNRESIRWKTFIVAGPKTKDEI